MTQEVAPVQADAGMQGALAAPLRLSVAAVAHLLGVAPATLRTWARRYGLGPSEHAPGAHRRYGPEDLARLQTMRRLTLQGAVPGDAAKAALAARAEAVQSPVGPLPDRYGRLSEPGPAAPDRDRKGARSGGPGGRVLALPGADAVVVGLGRAAMALDPATVSATVRAELERRGVVATWERVLRPVLVAVGDRWARTGQGIEVEHLLSDCITKVLRERTRPGSEPLGRRPVLLACGPDEQHALPLHALSAGLAERDVQTCTLGADMPGDALAAAVRRTGPALLFLWSQQATSAQPGVLAALPSTRPPTAVVVGGPGWAESSLPDRVTVAQDLTHALGLVDQALGA